MKIQKLICLMMAALLCLCVLSACNQADPGSSQGGLAEPAPTEPGDGTPSLPEAQKLIRTVWLGAETEDLDTLLATVEARIAELGGYVESRKVYNGSSQSQNETRYAELTVRIPAEKLDRFTDQVKEAAKITYSKETTENVALSYVALQSRCAALEAEEARLLELMTTAADMEEKLEIEKRLTEVRTELEETNFQLQLYDDLVDYGTVYLSLTELMEKEEQEQTKTLWDRISGGFMNSLKELGKGIEDLFVLLVVALPYLLVLAVAVLIVCLIRRKRKKKNKAEE